MAITQTFRVNPGPQTITFAPLGNVNLGVSPFLSRRYCDIRTRGDLRFLHFIGLHGGGGYSHGCLPGHLFDNGESGG